MKFITGFITLALSVSAFAGTQTKSFVYDGTQPSMELTFKGEKTHTEYKVEQVQSTCYRQEIVGYHTICMAPDKALDPRFPFPGPGPRPFPGPYPYPRPYPRTCFQEPIYRSVPYSCMETVRTPFEVKDFDVDARVLVDVRKIESQLTTKETLKVVLNGDVLSVETEGSGKFLIVQKKKEVRENMNGSVKFLDGFFAVELVEAAPVVSALKMTNIEIADNVLSFKMGPVASRANIGFSLNVVKKKFLASDVQIFDRKLTTAEVALDTRSAEAVGSVNVKSVGVNLESGKYALTAKAFFSTDGLLLNPGQFADSLEASRTLIYSIR